MTFGEKLQRLRARKGLSQDALAELLDVSRQAVSKWERDETMPEAEKITCPSAWREMLAIRAMRLATSMSRWVQVGDLNMTVSETMAAAINPAILAVGIRPLS